MLNTVKIYWMALRHGDHSNQSLLRQRSDCSDEGLTLETSAQWFFTVLNIPTSTFSWYNSLIPRRPSFLRGSVNRTVSFLSARLLPCESFHKFRGRVKQFVRVSCPAFFHRFLSALFGGHHTISTWHKGVNVKRKSCRVYKVLEFDWSINLCILY